MTFPRINPYHLPIFLLCLFFPILISHAASELRNAQPISGGKEGLVSWRRSVAEEPLVQNTSFILAAERTHRKDPLDGYERYTGGWNISNEHYWASVGFTAVPLFIIAIIWFVGFAVVLLLLCCCYCCCRQQNYSYSRTAYAISLVLVILFTLAAIIGCIILYTGQGKFHSSTSGTLSYVVGQADLTVDNLRNFSNSLAAAKKVGVDQIFLPADVQGRIDAIETKLSASANDLSTRTSNNSKKMHDVLDSIRLVLIVVAAVMLLLAFLGFLCSILGMQVLVYMFVLIGWILVAGTFILCGVFLLFHNVVADTCTAMDEWVTHPHEHTALDDILPCVDIATANESLYRSREVTFQLVNVVNQFVVNISNANFPPGFIRPPLNYNQSGPLMPALCNPYLPDMSNRTCLSGEVNFDNASQVWKTYICKTTVVNGSDICTTVGRVTPNLYGQMTGAVSVSHGLYYYGPFLTQLEDCSFVRETFTSISQNNCPGLDRYSRWIYIGLAMVSSGVMLSLILWVVYARERRHRKYNKQFISRAGHAPLATVQDKA